MFNFILLLKVSQLFFGYVSFLYSDSSGMQDAIMYSSSFNWFRSYFTSSKLFIVRTPLIKFDNWKTSYYFFYFDQSNYPTSPYLFVILILLSGESLITIFSSQSSRYFRNSSGTLDETSASFCFMAVISFPGIYSLYFQTFSYSSKSSSRFYSVYYFSYSLFSQSATLSFYVNFATLSKLKEFEFCSSPSKFVPAMFKMGFVVVAIKKVIGTAIFRTLLANPNIFQQVQLRYGILYYNIPSSMENCSGSYPTNAGTQANAPSKIALKHLKVVDKMKKPQSYIPFIFKNKKIVNSDQSVFPSPGQYGYRSSFEQIDSRQLIKQQYNILMENTKKIKQSANFKSTAKRFNYRSQLDFMPISYSNSPKGSLSKDSNRAGRKFFKKIFNKSMSDINSQNGYPSIPDKSVRFGYTVGNEGRLNKIEKTLNQLDKERDAMKTYTKKLRNEKKYRNEKDADPSEKMDELELIEKLREKVKVSMMDSIKAKSIFVEKAKLRLKENIEKCKVQKGKQYGNRYMINKIMAEKKNLSMHLGPGSYQIKDKLFGHKVKPEKFQFFSSTSERFPSYETTKDQKEDYQQLWKKMEIEKKIYISKRSQPGKMFQRIRKPERFTDRSDVSEKQNVLPGPADYNPSENITKVKVGKVPPFDKSARFEGNKQNASRLVEKRDISNQLTKQNFFVIQSRHKNRQVSKYPEFLQKNKQILRNKKELIEQSYKKYKTRGQSQYSICSWESRPFTRNQHLPSTLKQSIRIQ